MAGDDDHEAFRQAMRGVRPLHGPADPVRGGQPSARRTRSPRPAITRAATATTPAAGSRNGPEPGPQADPRLLRRLRRGEYRIDAEIDLHGLTEALARETLATFLAESVHAGHRAVRIVHGKGLRSGPRGPVLRALVQEYLPQVPAVQAFTSAPQAGGGSGASLVLLRPAARAPAGPVR